MMVIITGANGAHAASLRDETSTGLPIGDGIARNPFAADNFAAKWPDARAPASEFARERDCELQLSQMDSRAQTTTVSLLGAQQPIRCHDKQLLVTDPATGAALTRYPLAKEGHHSHDI